MGQNAIYRSARAGYSAAVKEPITGRRSTAGIVVAAVIDGADRNGTAAYHGQSHQKRDQQVARAHHSLGAASPMVIEEKPRQ
jgi:hypothetical protein